MTREETAKVIFTMRATYPTHFQKVSGEEMKLMVDSWQFVLGDYDAKEVMKGLKAYMTMDRSGFPPSASQIITTMTQIANAGQPELTAAEAWDLTYKAICGLSWENPEAEFKKLPTACQRAIGTANALAEIAAMDADTVLIGEKARFFRQYDAIRKQEKELAALPESVRELIGGVTMKLLEEG